MAFDLPSFRVARTTSTLIGSNRSKRVHFVELFFFISLWLPHAVSTFIRFPHKGPTSFTKFLFASHFYSLPRLQKGFLFFQVGSSLFYFGIFLKFCFTEPGSRLGEQLKDQSPGRARQRPSLIGWRERPISEALVQFFASPDAVISKSMPPTKEKKRRRKFPANNQFKPNAFSKKKKGIPRNDHALHLSLRIAWHAMQNSVKTR